MAEQIPLIDIPVEVIPEFVPPETEIFLVAAYRRCEDSGYWKIHRETNNDEHRTFDGAEAHARRLDGGWTHHCILRVRLGGNGEVARD